ncbi:tetraacyldisaccharide 4'-kinase [Flavobacterium sp. j3]|uniref:Tetraacyldisaccharide 4'-kinase n=1 Tax=Flavobacterium aureirubrum TaxID=3133147 RepID=A0ABU9N0M6_9FLAO
MILLRKLLFPFAILYGLITSLRNYLYDIGVFKSYSFDIPVIAVGNLSVGGTGKTPQIEYLIRLLSTTYKVATLSRGYKRKSKGFILANATSNADILGDEPFQYYSKFKDIIVAVDADRKNGIENLMRLKDKPEVILLDDAYQHRRVKAGFYILLTSYDDLYCDDFLLPTGNLRENKSRAKRANVIVVTKCSPTISNDEQLKIKERIGLNIPIYFSSIDYDSSVYNQNQSLEVLDINNKSKILLAGIAKPEPFFNYLRTKNDELLVFPDHHHFSESDILTLKNKAKDKIIITTEKDFVRLKTEILAEQLYYLPIKSKFVNQQAIFDKTILDYVGTSSRNR